MQEQSQLAQEISFNAAQHHQDARQDSATSTPAALEDVVCICGSDIDDNGTIQCDKCGRWQHMRCVGIDPDKVDDLEDLVYLCDVCDPRTLDVEAAKAYITNFQHEEAQALQVKPKRGRGKSASKRGSHTTNVNRGEARRARPTTQQIDSDGTDDLTERPIKAQISSDHVSIQSYKLTSDARYYIEHHRQHFYTCPSSKIPSPVDISVDKTHESASVRVLCKARTDAGTFVGTYLGLVELRDNYCKNAQNKFQYLRGPMNMVVFIDDSALLVDGRSVGNELCHIRKSCTPNCRISALNVQQDDSKDVQSWLAAVTLEREVEAGEELTIGYQWSFDTSTLDDTTMKRFAQDVHEMLGECACSQADTECLIARHLLDSSRKRSLSGELQHDGVDGRQSSADAETPLTREERKIQMAIARIENAEAPKTKRRRRNTSDEGRPASSRRVSNNKQDEPEPPKEELKRSASPDIPSKPRVKISVRSRAKLIRSPSPAYDVNDRIPRKSLWLRTYLQEKKQNEEHKAKLAIQAREAAERLEREVMQRKAELEARAREAREAKEREIEAARLKAEREAFEASQRAREREIWGDHRPDPPRQEPRTPAPIVTQAATPSPGLETSFSNATDQSPPVVPKIVKKLSVSEYMRQKKEKAASDALDSPGDRSFPNTPLTTLPPDDKSDGEVEAGEISTTPAIPRDPNWQPQHIPQQPQQIRRPPNQPIPGQHYPFTRPLAFDPRTPPLPSQRPQNGHSQYPPHHRPPQQKYRDF